jgi:tRNA-binding EMAP/Myf-like protein
MRRTKFRGQSSHGMFCSAAELGWQADGPDEVALLKAVGLSPGDSLEDADWAEIQAELKPWHLERRRQWRKPAMSPVAV